MRRFRLGLIGDNIATSRAPELHRFCGQIAGFDVSYDLLVPRDMAMTFDQVFEHARRQGYAGLNVTLPYKERVVSRVRIEQAAAARIGAVNTVRFDPAGPVGFNTDHSGFISAWRYRFGSARPGKVVLLGAGGVGKAVAFALGRLQADAIVIIDKDGAKAEALVRALNGAPKSCAAPARRGTLDDLPGADGVVNCTPLGMVGYGGTPVPDGAFPRARWAFDAVYTPLDTLFRTQALSAGAEFLSGYALYFHQGVHAFEIFTGLPVADHGRLRRLLDEAAAHR